MTSLSFHSENIAKYRVLGRRAGVNVTGLYQTFKPKRAEAGERCVGFQSCKEDWFVL